MLEIYFSTYTKKIEKLFSTKYCDKGIAVNKYNFKKLINVAITMW